MICLVWVLEKTKYKPLTTATEQTVSVNLMKQGVSVFGTFLSVHHYGNYNSGKPIINKTPDNQQISGGGDLERCLQK